MELVDLVRNAEGGDVEFGVRGRELAQALMDAEVTQLVNADHGERAPEQRTAQRNGYRPPDWTPAWARFAAAAAPSCEGASFSGPLRAAARARWHAS